MIKEAIFRRSISEGGKLMCYPVKRSLFKLNLENSFLKSVSITGSSVNHSFSSLSRSQEKSVTCRPMIKRNELFHIRTFSVKESLDSALVTHSAIFKWITESKPVEFAKTFIVDFHDYSGLPWWMSIIITTCIVRGIITFPIALYQNYVIARLENIRKEMNSIVNDIKYEINREGRRNKWPEYKAKRQFNMMVRKEWQQLIVRDNCHPAKIVILALFQIPTWITFSAAFRNLVYKLPYNDAFADLKCLELSVGGVAWFPNLLAADSFVLPITLGLINLSIIEIQVMMHKEERTRLQRYSTNFFRGLSIFLVPIAATVPSCLTLYWVTSSTFGLCQNLLFLSPKFRGLVGIPSTPSTIPKPYSHLAHQIRNKFRR